MATAELPPTPNMGADGGALPPPETPPEFRGLGVVKNKDGGYSLSINGVAQVDIRNSYIFQNREIIDRFVLSTGDRDAIEAYSAGLASSLYKRKLVVEHVFAGQARESAWKFIEANGGDQTASEFVIGLRETRLEDQEDITRMQRYVGQKGGDITAEECADAIAIFGKNLGNLTSGLAWKIIRQKPEIAARVFAFRMMHGFRRNNFYVNDILDVLRTSGDDKAVSYLGSAINPRTKGGDEYGFGPEYHGVVLDIMKTKGGDLTGASIAQLVTEEVLIGENLTRGWEIIDKVAGEKTATRFASNIGGGYIRGYDLVHAWQIVENRGGEETADAFSGSIFSGTRLEDDNLLKAVQFIGVKGREKAIRYLAFAVKSGKLEGAPLEAAQKIVDAHGGVEELTK
jgi:hypothetical protein